MFSTKNKEEDGNDVDTIVSEKSENSFEELAYIDPRVHQDYVVTIVNHNWWKCKPIVCDECKEMSLVIRNVNPRKIHYFTLQSSKNFCSYCFEKFIQDNYQTLIDYDGHIFEDGDTVII